MNWCYNLLYRDYFLQISHKVDYKEHCFIIPLCSTHLFEIDTVHE